MNEKENLENIIFDGLDGAPKESKPDVFRPIIAAVSAFLLIFSIILALTIAIINSNPTPKLNPNDSNVQTPPAVSETLAENRERVEVTNAANAEASTTLYRPADVSGRKNLGSDANITSKAALLEDLDAGVVIAAKNADEKVQIASMTKVMTLIVACDLIDDYYGVITINYGPRLEDYSITFVDKTKTTTEKVYYIDALYGLVLYSGADCAYAIAESLCGSEEAFVEKMNEKAAALGMKDTHFSSCVGKDDGGNNYSTMRDVATMFAYALKNERCYEILTTERWVCIGSYDCERIRSLVHMNLSGKSADMTFGKVKVLGGKSGNETLAKFCLVSFGEKSDGHKYICVTAGHASSSYADTIYIYENYVK
ncbi:MAG: D-alanyl-D-alanine carboxypeptidase [Clostridia bacterium]|nr:D-alanyl-D-alanine carboxypeptidase [Clostridia bacterium]